MKKFSHVIIIIAMILATFPLQVFALTSDGIDTPNPILVFSGNKTYIYSTITTTDGYIVAGTTQFDNGSTVFIQKIDKNGKVIWNTYVGGQTDYVPAYVTPKVIELGDYYYVVGSTQGTDVEGYHGGTCKGHPCSDILVAKVDKDGNLIWHKAYGTENEDIGYSAIADGNNIVVVGYVDRNTDQKKYGSAYVMKIDEEGNVIWSKDYLSYDKAEFFYDIAKVGDKYIVVGMAYKNYKDIAIFALDEAGNVLWHKYSNQSNWDEAYSVIPFDNNHFIIGGVGVGFENFHNGLCGKYPCTDGYVAMYDLNGNKIWGLSIGGTEEDKVYGLALYNGNIYAVGQTKSGDGDFEGLYTPHNCGKGACQEGFITVISTEGKLLDKYVYDSSTRKGAFYSIEGLDNGYIVAGFNSESKDDVDTGIIMPFVKEEETQQVPAVPTFTDYPKTTSVANVTIKGSTDDKATYVEVSLNDSKTFKADVNNQSFEITLTLQEGTNTIKARACNDTGCSDWSEPITITYKKETQKAPSVPTLDPLPSVVYQPYITISGKTDNLATKVEVFVGGEKYDATVNNQAFSVKVSLYAGENKISARACNDAGCSDFTKEVIVKYVTEVPAPVLEEPSTTTFYNTDTIEITGSSEVDGILKVYVNGEEKVSQNISKGTFSISVPVSTGDNYIKAKVCVNDTICSDFSNTITITVKERTTIEMWVGKAVYTKDGKQSMMDAAPFIMPPGRTVVPLRFVAEGLGFNVKWNGDTRQITITGKDASGNDTTIILSMPYQPDKKFKVGERTVYPGSSKVTVIKNGNKEVIDLKNYNGQDMGIPVIYAGRTYVPVRFISEIFGAQVLWDGKEYKITIIFER